MPVALIDDARVRRIIVDAVGHYATLAEAERAGVYVVPARDEAIELAMPLAPRAAQVLVRLPWASRCEESDIEQAACLGLIEAMSTYDVTRTYKGRPILPSTHLYWRIRKRVYEEVQDTHWTISRPARADIERYMKEGAMDDAERVAYRNAVLLPVEDPETYHYTAVGREDEYLSHKAAWELS
jgi:hypothetical protein